MDELQTEITASQQIPQEAFDWYDAYAHGELDRRTFLSRLAAIGLGAAAVSGGLMPEYALAEQVSFNDPDITASYSSYPSPGAFGTGRGYLVTPNRLGEDTAAVLVVHENRGLNPYIKDVTRRLAKQGFIAFAPDILHSLGGYPGNDDLGRAMQKSLDRAKVEIDFINAAQFLKSHKLSSDKLGVVGFCFGGYICNMLAARVPELIDAAAPFYGTPAKTHLIKDIKAPLMLHFASLDKRVNSTWSDYEKGLTATGVDYQSFVYEGVNHGFHNDSTARYSEAEAELAWGRTLEFFRGRLT